MYKHILIAVDFSEDHEPTQSLQAARTLADCDTRVSILHVKEEVPSYAIAYMTDDYYSGLKEAIQSQLDTLAGQFDNGTGVLIEGHSGRTILDWANAHAVDCIIIGSHRPGLEDYFMGSTAGRVVRHAQCSVHVAR